jgi:hypothetical protein
VQFCIAVERCDFACTSPCRTTRWSSAPTLMCCQTF